MSKQKKIGIVDLPKGFGQDEMSRLMADPCKDCKYKVGIEKLEKLIKDWLEKDTTLKAIPIEVIVNELNDE